MGGWLGIGHSGYKTDRNEQLEGYGNLENIFHYGMDQGKAQETAGSELEGAAGAHYTNLLQGDRNATLQEVQPVQTAVNAQTDANKRAIASSGTARGGGVNDVVQQMETGKNATVDSAIASAKTGAAAGAAGVGSVEVQQALAALGLGENAIVNKTDIASQSRKESDAHNQMVQEQTGQAIGAALKFFGL